MRHRRLKGKTVCFVFYCVDVAIKIRTNIWAPSAIKLSAIVRPVVCLSDLLRQDGTIIYGLFPH